MKGAAINTMLKLFKPSITYKVSKVRLITLGFAVTFPWVVLFWSTQHGRMAYSLGYDDVSYAVDSASRWNFFLNNSFIDVVSNLLVNPPHSPLSTFFGSLGFPFFGITDFGFYFGNAILFYLLVAVTYVIYAGLRFSYPEWVGDITVLVLICSPFGFYVVHDSRPDMATGYLTILAAVGVFGQKLNPTRNYRNFVALTLGLALVSKPPFIPHTFLMVALAFVLRWLVGSDRKGLRIGAKNFFDLALRTLVVSSPLLAIEFKPTLEYVIDNLFAKNKSVWTFPSEMSYVDIIVEYLHPWWMYMGGLITPTSLVLAVLLILALNKKVNPMLVFLTVLAASSLLFIAYLRYMNEYFFSSMHVAAVFMLPLVYFQLQVIFKTRLQNALRLGAAAVLCGLGLSVLNFAHYPAFPETNNTERNDKVIASYLKSKDISSLYLTFSGPINQDNISWESTKLGHNLQMANGTFETEVGKVVTQAKNYDTVLVPNLLSSTYNRALPSGAVQGEVISRLLSDGFGEDMEFRKLGTRYHLLRKGASADGTVVVSVDGLAALSFNGQNPGASAEWRSTLANTFSLCVRSGIARVAHLRLMDTGTGSGFFARLPDEGLLQSQPMGNNNVLDKNLLVEKGIMCIQVYPQSSSETLQIQTGFGTSMFE